MYDLESPLAVVDLETTGSQPASDRITEIGVIEVDGFEVSSEWSTLVNPGAAIPAPIQALTGITCEMVARGAGVRRPQRALRLWLPAARVRARRLQVPGEDAVHGAALAPAVWGLRGPCEPQPRQPDLAPRHRMPGAPPRAPRRGRGVAVPAHRRARARRRGARHGGPPG